MKYSNVYIASIGYELAPQVVTSDDIEAQLEPLYRKLHIPKGQLKALTGIEERRWWPESFRVSEGATLAARNALEIADFDPMNIEALIYTGVCRDHFEPATACHVAAGLGIHPNAHVFDLSNACLGVINGIIDIGNRIELGQIRAGLVVSCETARDITEVMIQRLIDAGNMDFYRYSLATLTGGSGAVAVLITDGKNSDHQRRKVLGGVAQAAPQHHLLCCWGMESTGQPHTFQPFMSTDSVSIFKEGIILGTSTWTAFLKEMAWDRRDVDRVITHQVGAGHRNTILKAIDIPETRDFPTFPFLGNIGTVSLPITAALAEERGFLMKGHRVGFLGIGSGLNCMMLGIEW